MSIGKHKFSPSTDDAHCDFSEERSRQMNINTSWEQKIRSLWAQQDLSRSTKKELMDWTGGRLFLKGVKARQREKGLYIFFFLLAWGVKRSVTGCYYCLYQDLIHSVTMTFQKVGFLTDFFNFAHSFCLTSLILFHLCPKHIKFCSILALQRSSFLLHLWLTNIWLYCLSDSPNYCW